ncbi:hypothetical protein M0P98_06235 [bacterium]|nr:hypothetical protein [bacterium]
MKNKNWVNLFIAILLFIPMGFLQVNIDYRRTLEDLEAKLLLMPGQVAGSLVLGGFRGVAADLIWLNIEEFWHQGHTYKLLPLFESVAWLQPRYITVWAVGGWHMAYNIYATIDDPEEKHYWYQQGTSFLKKGIAHNPEQYDLYFELGWTYYNKGEDYANAVNYLEKAVKFPGPDYVKSLLAHAYENNDQVEEAVSQWTKVLDTTFEPIAKRALKSLQSDGAFTPKRRTRLGLDKET